VRGNMNILTAFNLMRNGNKNVVPKLLVNEDFSQGITGWLGTNSAIIVSNGVLSDTGDGSYPYPYARQTVPSFAWSNQKLYYMLEFRVTNANCSQLHLRLNGTGGANTSFSGINNPVANQWYQAKGVATKTVQTGNLLVQIQHVYADSATANGKVMEVKNLKVVNLTQLFGAGNEPTLAQIQAVGFWDSVGLSI
jgi:hypothetical protein